MASYKDEIKVPSYSGTFMDISNSLKQPRMKAWDPEKDRGKDPMSPIGLAPPNLDLILGIGPIGAAVKGGKLVDFIKWIRDNPKYHNPDKPFSDKGRDMFLKVMGNFAKEHPNVGKNIKKKLDSESEKFKWMNFEVEARMRGWDPTDIHMNRYVEQAKHLTKNRYKKNPPELLQSRSPADSRYPKANEIVRPNKWAYNPDDPITVLDWKKHFEELDEMENFWKKELYKKKWKKDRRIESEFNSDSDIPF